jgi:hypothetical protein
MAASRGFRRLGDWAAGTLVVYTPKALVPPRHSGGPRLTEFAPLIPPVRLSYEEKQAVLMFARRYPLLGADRAEEITRPYVLALGAGAPSAAGYLLGIARKLAGEAL